MLSTLENTRYGDEKFDFQKIDVPLIIKHFTDFTFLSSLDAISNMHIQYDIVPPNRLQKLLILFSVTYSVP